LGRWFHIFYFPCPRVKYNIIGHIIPLTICVVCRMEWSAGVTPPVVSGVDSETIVVSSINAVIGVVKDVVVVGCVVTGGRTKIDSYFVF